MLSAIKRLLRPFRSSLRSVWSGAGQAPVNFQARDASLAAIARDVDYAFRIGREYLALVASMGEKVGGQTVLELGPGYNLGSLMLLACAGARPIAADRFPVLWDAAYHPAFYTALQQRITESGLGLDVTPLTQLLKQGGHGAPVIRVVAGSAEALDEIADGAVDIVLSNAVLEHLQDPAQAFAQLRRITRANGLGLHQVDFRDHRDFDRPLEYLLLDTATFETMFAERHGECGRQLRPQQMAQLLAQAGFSITRFEPNIDAPAAYLANFMPRLQASANSAYRDWSAADLQAVSGRFYVRAVPGFAPAVATAQMCESTAS